MRVIIMWLLAALIGPGEAFSLNGVTARAAPVRAVRIALYAGEHDMQPIPLAGDVRHRLAKDVSSFLEEEAEEGEPGAIGRLVGQLYLDARLHGLEDVELVAHVREELTNEYYTCSEADSRFPPLRDDHQELCLLGPDEIVDHVGVLLSSYGI